MIDISEKELSSRRAKAKGRIKLKRETISLIKDGRTRKGDPFEAAKIAGTLAVKNCSNIVPYCHPIPIDSVDFSFSVEEGEVQCECTVKANYRTGVEMEALTGVSVALLTIWDMVKYAEKDEKGQYPLTRIHSIEVVEKIKV